MTKKPNDSCLRLLPGMTGLLITSSNGGTLPHGTDRVRYARTNEQNLSQIQTEALPDLAAGAGVDRAPIMKPNAIRDEIEAIKRRASDRQAVADLPLLASELERIRHEAARTASAPLHPEHYRKLVETFQQGYSRKLAKDVEQVLQHLGIQIEEGGPAWKDIADK